MTGSGSGPAEVPGGLSFAQVAQELMAFGAGPEPTQPQPPDATAERPVVSDNPDLASLPALQSFLDAITTYRQRSGLSS